MLWTRKDIEESLSGLFPEFLNDNNPEWGAQGVSFNTRTLKAGDLYVALHGENQDGHDFVGQAFAKGAAAVLVDHAVALDSPGDHPGLQIIVKDTLQALTELGRFARVRTKATIIAVTGSVGKTTTKELLRHILGAFGETFASPASYNNHWGVPVSLACMPLDAQYGVFEVGMNHPGEIAPLAQLVQPHIGIITAIAEAHIGYMGSRLAIAEEKSDLFTARPAPGLAILNHDDLEFTLMEARAKSAGVSKTVSFGKTDGAAIRLKAYKPDPTGLHGKASVGIGRYEMAYDLPQPGEHIAMNSLIGLAVGEALGLSQQELVQQLETLPAIEGRGKRHQVRIGDKEILLIDDAFNANLASMQSGLRVLGSIPLPPGGRRLAILGEMFELGEQAVPHHNQLMQFALAQPLDLIFCVGGEVMKNAFFDTVPSDKAGGYFEEAGSLADLIKQDLQTGDILYIKGSKKSQVSKIVDALLALDENPKGEKA